MRTLCFCGCLLLGVAAAQAPQPSVAEVRRQLLANLRQTPAVAEALSADSSLLADQAYLERTNPAVADLVHQHPEVARNPDYYLFADLGPGDRGEALERKLWPDRVATDNGFSRMMNALVPILVLMIVAGFAMWLLRTLVDNRRWGRLMRVQSEAHNRLLEKFGSSQDVLAYMQSEAGRRFLESAPLDAGLDTGLRAGGVAGRVLISLQAGVVLAVTGGVLTALRDHVAGGHDPLLVFGALGLAVGGGLILSAVVAFLMAKHLRLLPAPTAAGDGR